ncbi:MAG: Spy/CpxP family protein refolding chaperone [Pseudomonas marincola]|jgi:Spy/CpxP family protein refolding chaperone|uniref:periplasmic heavy metal sensor n=1 Tax=Pseudomonas marincola TaxID=437900 RepID=UPI00300204C1
MRKTLTAVLLALTLPAVAMAAMPEGGPRHEGGHHGGGMFKELNLSKEQRQEMHKLMRQQMKDRHDITRKYLDKLPEAEQKAMKAEMDASRETQQSAMRALLKPEQQAAFDAQLKKMQERRAAKEAEKAAKPAN